MGSSISKYVVSNKIPFLLFSRDKVIEQSTIDLKEQKKKIKEGERFSNAKLALITYKNGSGHTVIDCHVFGAGVYRKERKKKDRLCQLKTWKNYHVCERK